MKRDWQADELAEQWTLLPGERELLANKSGATRLGFAVLLKFFRCAARFPQSRQEVPLSVVAFLAKQVRADDGGITRLRFANATGFEDALRKQPNIFERRADYRWRGGWRKNASSALQFWFDGKCPHCEDPHG